MAKIVFGMNLSLDGYVDHEPFAPDPVLFRHWIDHVKGLTGSVYGRRMYEVMRYWDEEHPEWDAMRKWVASRTQDAVGPNARLIGHDAAAAVRALKTEMDGEISVSGPDLAHSLGQEGLIDEYRLYYHPVVLGHGKPFFAGAMPRVRLVGSERIGAEVIRLTYVPG